MWLHTPAHKYTCEVPKESSKKVVPLKWATTRSRLSTKQVLEILDKENVGEFEAWQVLNLPINTTR